MCSDAGLQPQGTSPGSGLQAGSSSHSADRERLQELVTHQVLRGPSQQQGTHIKLCTVSWKPLSLGQRQWRGEWDRGYSQKRCAVSEHGVGDGQELQDWFGVTPWQVLYFGMSDK